MSERLGVTFARVRNHYRRHHAEIMASPNDWFDDAYSWEYEAGICLTPIERALWHDIRAEGVVLYPQFPVGRFFVDYANPAAMVAVECDGQEFHRDGNKDAKRQEEIEAMGWTVYRLTGSTCKMTDRYEEDEFGVERLIPSPARSLIRMIGQRHQVSLRSKSPTAGLVRT